jgi:putative tributyrin esterase
MWQRRVRINLGAISLRGNPRAGATGVRATGRHAEVRATGRRSGVKATGRRVPPSHVRPGYFRGMAVIRCDFFSESLELGTSMTVLLPQAATGRIGADAAVAAAVPPVLYLLHGLTDDDTAWTRYTSIERYADAKGLAVVMPQVHRSFYTDEAYGMKFWTFLSEELPTVVQNFFRVSARREDTFVAGLSMGGYGAMKWALRQPGRFAKAAALSGSLDLARRIELPFMRELSTRVFAGRPIAGTPDDLLHLLATADPAALPALMVRCGTEDHVYDQNERFVAACAEHKIALDAGFGPGAHEWGYWDREIRTVLDWIL